MPTIRILADGTRVLGSAGTVDEAGNVCVPCGAGDVLTARLDFTGWLGADTLSSVTWTRLDGATSSGAATSGAIATAQITIPDDALASDAPASDAAYRFRVTATSSAGRKHVTRISFVARGR